MRFSYSADVPLGIGNRGVRQAPPDSKICFSYYSASRPRGEITRMPVLPCFSYTGSTCFGY
jgi:hypothetical protein